MSSYVESWSMEEQKLMIECQRLQALADNRAGEIQRLKLALAEKNRAIIAQKAQIQLMEKMNKNLVKALGTKVTTISKPKKAVKKTGKMVTKPAGESKSAQKSNSIKEQIKKDIGKVMERVKRKSGNTVPLNSIVNMELKELKVQLAQWKKKEKITDIVVEHKKEMGKRGIHDCQYDVGRIMNIHPSLKVGEIRKYLKKDLPTSKKKQQKGKSIITQLRQRDGQ